MGFTRDLGFLNPEDVAGALESQLWETVKSKTNDGREHEQKIDMISASDRALTPVVLAVAEAGIRAFGGHAHVHVQATSRVDTQEESSAKGMMVRMVIVTLVTHTAMVPADQKVDADPKAVASSPIKK